MKHKKLSQRMTKKSSKKIVFFTTIHRVLAVLGVLIVICFLGLQLTQTKQSLASYQWWDSCSNNNQCAANQVCAYDWAHRKVCQQADCQAQWGGGTFYCSGNLTCMLDFGHHYVNHTCYPNCRPYKTYWGNYMCGYCDSNRDCSGGLTCTNHTCGVPSCASQGGTCARYCSGGKHEIEGKCDRYNRLSCCR